jgi:hypothetical protein
MVPELEKAAQCAGGSRCIGIAKAAWGSDVVPRPPKPLAASAYAGQPGPPARDREDHRTRHPALVLE